MNWLYFLKSLLCFIGVFGLYRYDIWWKKNKMEKRKELLSDYDKTIRLVKNFGLKITLLILGLLFLAGSLGM